MTTATPPPAADGPDDETICYCIGVSRGQIRAAIHDQGCRNLEQVVRATGAMGGCMTCRYDIEAVIAAERSRGDDPDRPTKE